MTSKIYKKIAIVVQRFHPDISGGSEKLISEFAKILVKTYNVTILTTKSLNYITWKNEIKENYEEFDGVKIYRFKTITKRNIHKFNRFTQKLIQKDSSITDDEYKKWVLLQGPNSPELINYIKLNQGQFDCFIFMTYLYYPTIYGLPLVKNKSILIPTLHDEPPAYFSFFKKLFTDEIFYSFNVPEELNLFKKIFKFTPKNYKIIGMNVSLKNKLIGSSKNSQFYLDQNKRYILYIGRMEGGKQTIDLIQYFIEWRKTINEEIKLFLIGQYSSKLTNDPNVIYTGYISEKEKNELIRNSICLVNPSLYESFSIVLMEAWLFKIPVLVNGKNDVLKGHCIRSNGGLFYTDFESFSGTLDYILDHKEHSRIMGENGKKYVEMNYNEEIVSSKLLDLVKKRIN